MKNSRSGIKIYRTGAEKIRKNRGIFPLFLLQTMVMCILMILWWNAFLSVFHMPFHKGWLYAGSCVWIVLFGWAGRKFRWKAAAAGLTAAGMLLWLYRDVIFRLYQWTVRNYTSVFSGQPEGDAAFSGIAVLAAVPVVELLLTVQRRGRGKGWAALALAVPFFAAAAAGKFQSELPAWLLIVGAAVYFASAGLEKGRPENGKKFFVWKHAVLSVLLSAALAFVSFQAGKLLDVQRNAQNGYYLQTRSLIRTEVIGGVQDLLERSRGEEQTEEDARPDGESSSADPESNAEESGESSYSDILSPADESGMEDLGSLAYFRPESGQVSSVDVDEKPEGTVYVLTRWGVTYSDNAWTEENITTSVLTPPEGYRSYPEELRDTLEMLCGSWDIADFGDVSQAITRELSERAVYDTNPGATPAGKDFVEYFLLENHKGFCVHFATAAALMYRYCGYTARYAEGYAVPASAFQQNSSGGYTAQITGSMGHAWCQVYEEQTGEWEDMEHTPPAPEGADIRPPAADSADFAGQRDEGTGGERNSDSSRLVFRWSAAVLGMAAAAVIIFLVQAAVRLGRRKERFARKKSGEGIREMYAALIKTAEFQGVKIKDPLGKSTLECLEMEYPELKKEEWNWLYNCVLAAMFYHLDNEKKDWRKMKILYTRFGKAARGRMDWKKRLLYRCVYCLG